MRFRTMLVSISPAMIILTIFLSQFFPTRASSDTVGDAIKSVENGDYQRAIPVLEMAVKNDNPAAAIVLGLMYEFGNGIPQNFQRAMELYAIASSGGVDTANFNIGEMYFQGRGVSVDYQRALQWFRQGAALGHPLAQFRLAIMHQDGLGVPQNTANALVWYNIAIAGGYQNAETLRDELIKQLDKDQIRLAQETAVNCMASNLIDCPY
jgi:TPR repeat protein